jgi:hypothetical protein
MNAPDVNNYYIGKGIVSFKKVGDSVFRDLGNVPVFEFTPTIEKLDHFSSRTGVKTKDRTVVISKSATIKLTLEEWNAANLALALLGEIDTNTSGQEVIEIFGSSSIKGELKFTGANAVGATYEWHLLNVEFIPGDSVSPINEEWGTLQVTGEVATGAGNSFGTVTKLAEQA